MGKIKNWDKKRTGSRPYWVNRHPSAKSAFGKELNRGTVEIQESPDGDYVVFIRRYAYKGEDMVDKSSRTMRYDTKQKARKQAVKWMRNHPTG